MPFYWYERTFAPGLIVNDIIRTGANVRLCLFLTGIVTVVVTMEKGLNKKSRKANLEIKFAFRDVM